jgi:endonuclease/exonuclease/phosphatase family metal-dependent hydrolase
MIVLLHNVYWFQGEPPRWGRERVAEVPEVLEALTGLYAAHQPDLLGLCEVHRPDLADTLAGRLDMASRLHAPGGLRPDYGGALLCRGTARLSDHTRPVEGPPHERIHLRASVETPAGRLEAALVHLPSDRFAGPGEAGHLARVDELKRVLALAPRPNLIMGDMNGKPDSPPYRLLRDSGYTDAAAALQDESLGRRRVDYIWLDEAWSRRLVRFASLDHGAFHQQDAAGTGWTLSDHPPLLAELSCAIIS